MKITAVFEGKEPVFSEVRVQIVSDNGIETLKTLHVSEFVAILENSATGSNMVPVGILPKGFYDGVLSPDKATFKMAVLIPSDVRPMNYYGDMYYVPFPALMFTFSVMGGRVNVSNVYALDTDNPTEKSKVYHYPYGNVYDDGHICWGSNVLEIMSDKKDIEKVVALFFGSETNDDLFRSGKFPSQRALLEDVKARDVFPTEYLKRKDMLLEDVLEEVRY